MKSISQVLTVNKQNEIVKREPALQGIKASEIKDEIMVCPYCGTEDRGRGECCGEVHFEEAYILNDGDLILKSECIVLEDQ